MPLSDKLDKSECWHLYQEVPVLVRAKMINREMVLVTTLGPQSMRKGDFIVEGCTGELMPVAREIFLKKYRRFNSKNV